MQTVAGNGMEGDEGDGGRAVDASLGAVFALVADGEGNLLIASNEFNITPDGQQVLPTDPRRRLPNGIIQ